MATAATGALVTSHGPPLQLLTRLHHLNSLERSLPHRIAMDLLDSAAQDCAKRSSRPRPCRQPRAEGAVPSISCSQLDQPPLPLRCPRCGWLTAARSEPARCRVKCRAIDTSSDRPRAEERSRAGRPAAGGRHRVRSGAARWPERPAWAAPGDRLRFGGADRSPGVGL